LRRLGIAAVCLCLFAAGCGTKSNVLGTAAGRCFKAFPSAWQAVHNKGTLKGARMIDASRLTKLAPESPVPGNSGDAVCLVAFEGPYSPGEVEHARTPRGGRFAVVVVTLKDKKAILALVSDRLPQRFGHL
jgi:hypothetical protein